MRFPSTHWSLIAAAGGQGSNQREALAELCRTYRPPLHAYARRLGHRPSEADDLVQGFITSILESDSLSRADPARGRFRTYLLGGLRRHATKHWQHRQAAKRGGGATQVGLDEALHVHATYAPEAAFDRGWAALVLERVRTALRDEYLSKNQYARYVALEPHLVDDAPPPHAESAAQLGLTTGAFKVALHRLRRRFAELLRAEIAHTVCDPEDIDDELRHLLAAVAGENSEAS
jgi:RNA polymerase sigma-70 factor (ECF subfamily)